MTLSHTDLPGPSINDELARKLLSPDGPHRLLNDTVFQFNDHYRRFCLRNAKSLGTDNDEGVALIVPIMFDKASRTFNWIALSDPFLGHPFQAGSEERDDAQAARRKVIAQFLDVMAKSFSKHDNKAWIDFKGRFSDSPHAQAALKCVETYIRADGVSRRRLKNSLKGDDLTRLWIAAATIHSCYSHPRDQYFEGLFYTVLESFGWQHPDLVGWPVFGLRTGTTIDLSDWLSQPNIAKHMAELKLRGKAWNGDAKRTMRKAGYRPDRVHETKVTEKALLDPLLYQWSITAGKTTKLFKDWLEDFKLVVLQPLYDVWIGRNGFGSLQGVLIILLRPDADGVSGRIGKPSLVQPYNELLERCDEFARDVSQTSIQRALATPIEPPYDLIRHFLRILKEVQDWEEAAVFYDGEANYCYYRERHNPSDRPVRTHWIPAELTAIEGPIIQAGGMIEQCGHFYMWWTCIPTANPAERGCYNLWSQDFLAELTEDERLAFQGTSIRFKFPKACRIPSDAASRSLMVEYYLRQQLELMRVLIPKVRARRAALRNAVSAIMGRNMSHNIGSHVLARYANQVTKPLTIDEKKPDPRSDFLLYLQRRMDFLAEIATSDQALSAQPLVLRDLLETLNIDAQRKRYGYPRRAPEGGLPLLQNITGKHKLNATVVFEACNCANAKNLMFACPGGEVGAHALFVILENIIRNSARHNSGAPADEGADESVMLIVRAQGRTCTGQCEYGNQQEYDSGLIELRIYDPRTRLDAGGYKLDGIAGELTGPHSPVHHHINDIIQRKRIVEEDGRPSPHYWGIREMQVCAQYLRQLPLSDLEDGPYDLESTRHPGSEAVARKAPLIRAECAKLQEEAYCLSYVVYVNEARLLAVLEPANIDAVLNAPDDSPPGVKKFPFRRDRPELDDIATYCFVAYPSDLQGDVEKIRSKLPVRLIELSAHPGLPGGHSGSAEEFVESFRHSPMDGLESLHEAYVRSSDLLQTSGSGPPVGLVIAKDGLESVNATTAGPIHLHHETDAEFRSFWQMTRGLPKQSARLCLWLDHGSDAAIETVARLSAKYSYTLVSCEAVFSGGLTHIAVLQVPNKRAWELLASAATRVLILDERVQAELGTEIRTGLTLRNCWRAMGLEVPEPVRQCNLDYPVMTEMQAYLEELAGPAIDHVLIHVTILEKLCGAGKYTTVFDALRALIANVGPLRNASITFVTGRGRPAFAQSFAEDNGDTSGLIRYLPISAILEYINRYPSKLGLMRAIWSASGARKARA